MQHYMYHFKTKSQIVILLPSIEQQNLNMLRRPDPHISIPESDIRVLGEKQFASSMNTGHYNISEVNGCNFCCSVRHLINSHIMCICNFSIQIIQNQHYGKLQIFEYELHTQLTCPLPKWFVIDQYFLFTMTFFNFDNQICDRSFE